MQKNVLSHPVFHVEKDSDLSLHTTVTGDTRDITSVSLTVTLVRGKGRYDQKNCNAIFEISGSQPFSARLPPSRKKKTHAPAR